MGAAPSALPREEGRHEPRTYITRRWRFKFLPQGASPRFDKIPKACDECPVEDFYDEHDIDLLGRPEGGR